MAEDMESAEPAEHAESAEEAERPARPPVSARQSLTRFAMIFLGLLAVFSLFDQGISNTFGSLAGIVLFPIIGFGGHFPLFTIFLAGMMTTTISAILRDHYTDWVKTVRYQKVMAAWNKENMDAMRKGDQTRIKKMREFRNLLMADQMSVTMAPLKATAWTFFMFIVLFVWLRTFVDGFLPAMGNQYIAVPWASQVFLDYVPLWLPSWLLLYSLLAIPIGQILTRVLKYIRFRRRLLAMGLPLKAQADEAA